MLFENKKRDFKDFDNICITAFRILSILNSFLKEPLSDDDINQKLQENIEGYKNLSKDTVCIYINTLRAIGCEILRPSKNNGYKHVLKSHPFKLNLSRDEINTIIEIRKYISTLGDWKLAIEIDDLLNQIFNFTNPESKNFFLDLKKTILCREVNIENILPELNLIEKYCNQNKDIMLIYNSPNSGEKEIYIKAEKLTLENGSFYVWGYNYELNQTLYLRLDRIKSIKVVNIREKNKNNISFEVKYKLTGSSAFSFVPSKSDNILNKNDAGLVIQSKVVNKFKFIQDVLSYGPDCTVISPENIRKEVISRLKLMSEAYQNVNTM
jgi:predicted DNA-binding transcriptional regulator YafY